MIYCNSANYICCQLMIDNRLIGTEEGPVEGLGGPIHNKPLESVSEFFGHEEHLKHAVQVAGGALVSQAFVLGFCIMRD